MASIVNRYKKYYVVYTLPKEVSKDFYERNGIPYDESSKAKPTWEPFATLEAAENRKKLVEAQIEEIKLTQGEVNHLKVMRVIPLSVFIKNEFIPSRAKKWEPGTYTSNVGLLQNHVIPHLGEKAIQAITTADILELYDTLAHTLKNTFKYGVRVREEDPPGDRKSVV